MTKKKMSTVFKCQYQEKRIYKELLKNNKRVNYQKTAKIFM